MLHVKNLHAAYGSAQILNDASLSVENREVVALLGRNGVGKTTLLKTIMGIVPPSSGKVVLDDTDIANQTTHQIARSGIAYVPQGRGIFDKLTVEENLTMGLRACRTPTNDIPSFIFEKFPILHERRNQLAGTMSGGQKQQLAISRALCSDPKVLLLDEPSEGIQPNIVREIGLFLRELIEQRDISILIVEQNLELIGLACDRFKIMVRGQIVHEGENEDLNDEAMLKEYLSV